MSMEEVTLVPQISVILPTCRRVQLALECIDSIMQGDFSEFEIIVVDQDQDGLLKTALAERFGRDKRIVYQCLHEAALDKARNVGIERSRGEIMVFVDDDVEVDKGWLRAYADAFDMIQPSPGVVAGRLDPVWLALRPTWLPEDREYLFGLYPHIGTLRPMPEGDLPIGANFAVRREAAVEAGRFDERLDYSYARRTSMISGGDSLLSLRVKQAGYSIYYQPAAVARHKISKRKLTPKYFLVRSFWDGVTLLSILYLTGSVSQANAHAVTRWHLKEIARQIWRLLLPTIRQTSESTCAKRWMRTLSCCANSLGIIYASLRLRRTGELP
jgi:glucosyl-dolichyl phosphate glucuronosyltransferase